jgi:alpha-L-fucosidase 2
MISKIFNSGYTMSLFCGHLGKTCLFWSCIRKTLSLKVTLFWIFMLSLILPGPYGLCAGEHSEEIYPEEQTAAHGHDRESAAFQMDLDAPIDRWDEAIPLGNGLIGGLLWGRGKEIRLSLDRGDLWDNRAHPGFTTPGFNYDTVVHLAQSGQTDLLNSRFAKVSDYPTKMPGARLVMTLSGEDTVQSFQLDMKSAVGTADFGSKILECLYSVDHHVAMLRIPDTDVDYTLLVNDAVAKLGTEVAVVLREKSHLWMVQDGALGFRYVIDVRSRVEGDETVMAIAITTNGDAPDPVALAARHTQDALEVGFDEVKQDHLQWWSDFWSKSSVDIPDNKILQHYNLVQYFYGAASKKGAPPMPLQGLWTADDGGLPPWHGDYHHDLNTQLTYWAYLTSNRFAQGESFLDFMWSLVPVHEDFARDFYGLQAGHVVPGVMALDGRPMGSWFQYTLSPTMGAWVAQSFYWHWRYTMDTAFLYDRAYPYCSGIGKALAGLMELDEDGKLLLPLSSSPEIHNNTQAAWLTPNSNFDLSLIRWLFGSNAEMAEVLNEETESNIWKDLLARMEGLAVEEDDGALRMAPDESLHESHRHFSHLMAIHPLGILNVDGSERDRKIIGASLAQIDALGTQLWTGYSFSWMACMRARAGQADRALEYLEDYVHSFILRNGFHCNGEQTRKGLSSFHYRPFTLEGNFAAAQAVHEMLLQSWGGKVRVFPAVPEQWRDLSFEHWRAEGGFVVTAERKNGDTQVIRIESPVGGALRLVSPWRTARVLWEKTGDMKSIQADRDGVLTVQTRKGDILVFSRLDN